MPFGQEKKDLNDRTNAHVMCFTSQLITSTHELAGRKEATHQMHYECIQICTLPAVPITNRSIHSKLHCNGDLESESSTGKELESFFCSSKDDAVINVQVGKIWKMVVC